MTYKLIKNAHQIYGNKNAKDIVIKNNKIDYIGDSKKYLKDNRNIKFSDILDASGCVVYPGFINTHHHFFQSLTRASIKAQEMKLFNWLKYHYNIWEKFDESDIYNSSIIAMGEMMLYGVTTSSDQLYIYPKKYKKLDISPIETQIKAAKDIGMRSFFTRAYMDMGKSSGGLPPDSLCEDMDFVLKDSIRLIEKYHNNSRNSMCRISLGPCSLFNVSYDLYKESIKLARSYKIKLHTHLAETMDEEKFCLNKYGKTPIDLASKLGLLGSDIWFAHAIYLKDEDIKLLAKTGTGVSHCPQSNMRLASGVCQVIDLLKNKVNVSVSVDGASSNDNSNIILEMRLAMLLQRAVGKANSLSVSDVFDMATVNAAKVLGINNIGSLKVGNLADIAVFDFNSIEFLGSQDLGSALIFCGPFKRAKRVYIDGKITVDEGKLVNIDEQSLINMYM